MVGLTVQEKVSLAAAKSDYEGSASAFQTINRF